MKKTLLLTLPLMITACQLLLPAQSTTPPPTEELTATGSYTHKAGADQIAREAAEKFCKHWRAVPMVISTTTTYKGKLLSEAEQEGVNSVISSIPIIDGFGNKSAYETTLKYKCYQ